jgi:hypothetical protein
VLKTLLSTLCRIGFLTAVIAACAAATVSASTFGVNAHVPQEAVADEVVEAGIGWVRIDFQWSAVELERDVYDWKRYDALLDRLEARGLRVYAGLASTPAWATSGSELSGVPDDPDQWQEFCYLAASRYRGRIDAWGLWNEPNLDRFWEGSRSEYIDKILRPGAAAIRAADPGALIAAPDLAHLSSANWDDWLERVIWDAGDVIDVVTHHIYPSYGKAWEVTYDLDKKPTIPFGSRSVRRILKDTGWWGRPFWLTETGIESAKHGQADQAKFYENLLEDWFGPNPEARWVDRIFFYHMTDGPDPTPSTFGILNGRPDLVRKAAFYAYRDFITDAVVDDAEIFAHSTPIFLAQGETIELPITFRNTGSTTWRQADGVHLEVTVDSQAWETGHAWFLTGLEVLPNETVDLLIRLTAPSEADTATLSARMTAGDGHRFGELLRTTIAATDNAPPEVLAHPRGGVVPEGRTATLSVQAASDTELRYRWRRNSVELSDNEQIEGSDSPRLTMLGLDRHLEGDYDCVITNEAGSVVTRAAHLAVGIAAPRRPADRAMPVVATSKVRMIGR